MKKRLTSLLLAAIMITASAAPVFAAKAVAKPDEPVKEYNNGEENWNSRNMEAWLKWAMENHPYDVTKFGCGGMFAVPGLDNELPTLD